jgi:uncharacterized glyoxalase superfamily protein PhnB
MFNTMFPELFVSDCEQAAAFFEKALGYQRGFTYTEGDHLDFVVLKHPDPGLELLLHRMLPADESAKPRTVRLHYELNNIADFCAHLKRNGFPVSDPKPTTYGATTAHLPGPDGYEISFQQWNKRQSPK